MIAGFLLRWRDPADLGPWRSEFRNDAWWILARLRFAFTGEIRFDHPGRRS